MSALLQNDDTPPTAGRELVGIAPASPLRAPTGAPRATGPAAPRRWALRPGWMAAAAALLIAALAGWSTRSASVTSVTTVPNATNPAASASPADETAAAVPEAREPAKPSVLATLADRITGAASAPSARPPASPEALLKRAAAVPGSPESRLLRVYALMAASDSNGALEEARKLTVDVPNFALAHLVYGDLLKARTAPLPQFGAAAPGITGDAREPAAPGEPSPADRLKELSAEARLRVGSATGLPPPGAVPAQFVFLAPNVKHAIAVDASRSRLYLFENTPSGLVLKRDFYASVGKLGTSKRVEGDLRTPLGVYFVTGRLSKQKLADRYGATAMVLNYPNQYDQLRGRTGSGIWLHGVESAYFARAPLATDGCVALSNVDLLALSRDVDRQATPVVIAERLDWVEPADAAKPPAAFTQAFDAWRSARQASDPSAELGFYAADARFAASPAAQHWIDAVRAARSRPGSGARELNQMSVLAWHDQDEVMLVTYSETTARDARPRLKRQYWLRQDDRWRIVFDGAVG